MNVNCLSFILNNANKTWLTEHYFLSSRCEMWKTCNKIFKNTESLLWIWTLTSLNIWSLLWLSYLCVSFPYYSENINNYSLLKKQHLGHYAIKNVGNLKILKSKHVNNILFCFKKFIFSWIITFKTCLN
jgi:hypothetical protein